MSATVDATDTTKKAWQIEADQRTKELTDKLEAGMNELFTSEKYKAYLQSMSKFHNYSSRNIMLIHQQMPGATQVASYKLWKDEFNRQVKKGATSIRIYAPIGMKEPKKVMMEKLDPATGAPMLDKEGKIIMEEMTEVSKGPRFKLVPVFDVSQTYGDPLPQLIDDLTGNVAHYDAFMDALKAVSPLPIIFEPMEPEKDGYCRYGKQIGIREGMSEPQIISAVVHEITHARLHDKNNDLPGVVGKPKGVKEIEAESVAYVVCQKYGIDTGANSFGYLASWSNHDIKEVRASLDIVRKEANSLINDIDDRFNAICKDRDIELNPKEPEQVEHIPAAEESEKPTEPTFTVEPHTEIPPDTSVNAAEMNMFGYTYEEMLPVGVERAVELFNSDSAIYLLYSDNTEAIAYDVDEINKHDGMFGIERRDWLNSKEYQDLSAQGQEAATTEPVEAPTIDPAQISLTEPEKSETAVIPKNEQPIYKFDSKIAKEKGEIEAFRLSRKLNVECGEAIEKTINDNSKQGPMTGTQYVDTEKAARSVIAEYGADRVAWVLATFVQDQSWDGRLSNANKEWAKTFDTPGKPDVYLKTHITIIDCFINRFREIEKEKPSLLSALEEGAKKIKSQQGLDAPQISKANKDNRDGGSL